jgi:hypothetical protein
LFTDPDGQPIEDGVPEVLNVDLSCEPVNPDIVFRDQLYVASNRFKLLGPENTNSESYRSNDVGGTGEHVIFDIIDGVASDLTTDIPALGFTNISVNRSLGVAMDCPDGLGGTISTSVSGDATTTTSASVDNSVATFTGNLVSSFTRTRNLCGNLYNRASTSVLFTFDLKKSATLEANYTCDGTVFRTPGAGQILLRRDNVAILSSATEGCAVNLPIPAGRYEFKATNINHNGNGEIELGDEGGSLTLSGSYQITVTIDP